MNLKHIQAFVAVADMRSFRRAAERLGTTQPNISTRIADLEARLGLTLMERDAGSVRLTPKGEALLPRARDVLSSVDAFVSAAEDDSLFEGVIRLGVTEIVAHLWLGRFLKALNDRFPNVLVDLSVDLSANLSAALFSHQLDLTFQSGPFPQDTTGRVHLESYPLKWMAAPALGLSGRPVSLNDLADTPFLAYARNTMPYKQLTEHLAQQSARRIRLAPSTNVAACQQMTVDGLGIACLPVAMAADDLAAGRLELVDYEWAPDPLTFEARYDAETARGFVREAASLAAQIAAEDSK